MMLKCVIIEDEPLARDIIKEYIEEIDGLQLKATLKTGIEAYEYLTKHKADLLFLDIEIPKLQGNELLNSLSYDQYVIFTTAYSQYALESFEHNTIDYLTKPISFPRFLKAVNKAFHFIGHHPAATAKLQQETDEFLFLKFNHHYRKIYFSDILWIEGLADYQKMITEDNFYFYYATLKQLEEQLPSDKFLRVHHSYIVNIQHVDAFQGNRIFIKGHEIPISRKYRESLKDRLGID